MELKFGVEGRIVEGDYTGAAVKITEDSGGYLLVFTRPTGEGWDEWVLAEVLPEYVRDARWVIDWD